MSKKISELTAGTTLTGSEQMEMVQSGSKRTTTQEIGKATFMATAGGTDTYTATLSPALTAYTSGDKFYVLFSNGNTGAATLNLNSLGAKSIKKSGTTALSSGDIAAGQVFELVYDGTNFQIVGGVGSGGSGIFTEVTISVSSAEILNLNSSPKELIAAPGTGKYINVISGYIYLTYASAYSNTTTEIRYGTGSSVTGPITSFLNVGVNELYELPYNASLALTPSAFSNFENKALNYTAPSANPTGGTSTIKINLVYRVVTV